jgi:hypothetical protein
MHWKASQFGKPTDYLHPTSIEIDTRADTVCAGSTSILHEFAGKVVDVSGFHKQLDPIKIYKLVHVYVEGQKNEEDSNAAWVEKQV